MVYQMPYLASNNSKKFKAIVLTLFVLGVLYTTVVKRAIHGALAEAQMLQTGRGDDDARR